MRRPERFAALLLAAVVLTLAAAVVAVLEHWRG